MLCTYFFYIVSLKALFWYNFHFFYPSLSFCLCCLKIALREIIQIKLYVYKNDCICYFVYLFTFIHSLNNLHYQHQYQRWFKQKLVYVISSIVLTCLSKSLLKLLSYFCSSCPSFRACDNKSFEEFCTQTEEKKPSSQNTFSSIYNVWSKRNIDI
jgi:hypothetical protein